MKTITLEYAKREIRQLQKLRDEAKDAVDRAEEWNAMDSADQEAAADGDDFEGEPDLEDLTWEFAVCEGEKAQALKIYAYILGVQEWQLEAE